MFRYINMGTVYGSKSGAQNTKLCRTSWPVATLEMEGRVPISFELNGVTLTAPKVLKPVSEMTDGEIAEEVRIPLARRNELLLEMKKRGFTITGEDPLIPNQYLSCVGNYKFTKTIESKIEL